MIIQHTSVHIYVYKYCHKYVRQANDRANELGESTSRRPRHFLWSCKDIQSVALLKNVGEIDMISPLVTK